MAGLKDEKRDAAKPEPPPRDGHHAVPGGGSRAVGVWERGFARELARMRRRGSGGEQP